MLKIYPARAMTGRVKEEVVAEAQKDKAFLESAGFIVLCPVISEQVKPTKEVLLSSKKAMDQFWPRDKAMIREANIVFDMTPGLKSEGVAHELGYARYFLYKPVFRVFRDAKLPPPSSVAYYEDDFITDSLEEAALEAYRMYGTVWQRLKWRLKLYKRCWWNMLKCSLGEWK